jgi:O-antigen/teichoic acid export membrane protein
VKLVRNFLSLAGAETFTKFINFVAFAYLARLLGASGFGYVEWGAAVLMCASLIVDQGFSAYGTREIAKDPRDTPGLVAEVVTARFSFAAIAYVALFILAFGFVEQPELKKLVLVYGLSLWLLPFNLQWVFLGHDRMHLAAAAQVIRQTVFVILVFTFVRTAGDLLLVGAAEVAGVFSVAAFTLWAYRRSFPERIRLRPAYSLRLLREGMPIGFSQMFWVTKMFGATFIVGFVATAQDTGYFSGAMRIYIALHTFVWLYFANLLPSFSRAWNLGGDRFSELIGNSMRIVVPAGLLGAVLWTLAAPLAMSTAYGQDFLHGAAALQWLSGACFAAAISGHYRFGLIAAGCQNKEMWASAFGAGTAVFLIPVLYAKAGISGTAAALCIAEFLTLLTVWIISKRHLFNTDRSQFEKNGLGALPETTR